MCTTRLPPFSRVKVGRCFERMARLRRLKSFAPGRSTICRRIIGPPLGSQALRAILLAMTRDPTGSILDALQFAAFKHRDQRRKDHAASPYINHPIALANVLWHEGAIRE